jgi:hypothetical protein
MIRINKLLVFNICFIAAFGWWAAFRLASIEEDHSHNILAPLPIQQHQEDSFPRDLHYDSSFADAEPYGMVETFDTVYFDGYTEQEPITRH